MIKARPFILCAIVVSLILGLTGFGLTPKQPSDRLIASNYFDLEVIERGYIDASNLFVTGGSGGGVLTCWVIGRTERFAAAVSQYFRALKLQKKEARLVRVPDEPHGIRRHPSHYVSKILHIQDWFEKHRRK